MKAPTRHKMLKDLLRLLWIPRMEGIITPDEMEIFMLYLVEEKSIQNIAKEMTVSEKFVIKVLNKVKEIGVVTLLYGSHKDNSMFVDQLKVRLTQTEIALQKANQLIHDNGLMKIPESEYDEPLLLSPLREFDNLSVGLLNVLKREDINTIGDLVAHTKKDLLNMRYLGKKLLMEAEEFLDSKGLSLKPIVINHD